MRIRRWLAALSDRCCDVAGEIDGLRDRMDRITLDMTRLLGERIGVAREIGRVKKTIGKGVSDEGREMGLHAKIVELSREIGLDEGMASRFLNFLLNESVMVQSGGKQSHLSVFRRAKELEGQGRRIIHMEVGEPDFMPPPAVGAALAESFEAGMVRYGDAAGVEALRSAIADRVAARRGPSMPRPGPRNVLVTPGARFSIFLAVSTLLNPGDEMIIIEPAWPAYRDFAMRAGVKVRAVGTTLDGGWEPGVDEIARLVNANTRMIVLNYPNNPTGKVLPAALQDEVVGLAKRSGLYVLSDEIYAAYAGDGWKSVLEYGYDKAVVVQSFSKSHAMTGFRVGYTVAHEAVVERMAALQGMCMTSVAEPVQHAALAALDEDVSGNAALIRERLDVLAREAGGMGLEFAHPDGAMYVFARVAGGGAGGGGGWSGKTRLLVDRALEEEGLALAPGEGFGDYGGFIRISACSDVKTLKEGMGILGRILKMDINVEEEGEGQ